MSSRKKAKGQARKAAKVKKEEAAIAEKAREEEEKFHRLEQSQIQRLQISNEQTSVLSTCLHGFDPFTNDDVCIKFIRAFVREFYKRIRMVYTAGMQDERAAIDCLSKAREVTQAEYSEVWNSADKIKRVIKYFLYNGTMNILANGDGDDIHGRRIVDSAGIARYFEQWLKVEVHKSQACIDWLKLIDRCDEHTLVKYFRRRIRCSCLDKMYEEVKSIPKMGLCFNSECKGFVERSKLRCCSRCRSVTYCSRECQVADWSKHTSFCDDAVARRAWFDANQQQQS